MAHGFTWKVDRYLADQGIPYFHGARWFITMFTKAHHWTMS